MNTKHTPGPWFSAEIGTEHSFVYTTDDQVVCRIRNDVSGEPISLEDIANARLIAAAPELLEACKRAFDQTDKGARPADWEMLRTAIAKATGAKTP